MAAKYLRIYFTIFYPFDIIYMPLIAYQDIKVIGGNYPLWLFLRGIVTILCL